jgi:hypothetical protein
MKKIFLSLALLLALWGDVKSQDKPVELTDLKTMTLDQLVTAAEAMMNSMNETMKSGFEMIKDARGKQDLQRMNCLNEAMSGLKGLMRISEQNMMDLQDKVARKDIEGARHEFVKISIASSKAKEIDTQLKACGGPSAEGIFEVEPIIEKDFDVDLPKEDSSMAMEKFIVNIDTISAASPFY